MSLTDVEAAERRRRKNELRVLAEAARRQQPDKDALSRIICQRFASLPEYLRADTVLLYVHVRSEVRTCEFLPQAMAEGKRVLVPWCQGDELELFHLEDLAELGPGAFGLLEPRPELRTQPGKQRDIAEVDLVMVPGVAFDRRGGRLGHGKGYYDRLLCRARADTLRVGVCYESQLVPEVPMGPRDVPMHRVITESAIYACEALKGRGQ